MIRTNRIEAGECTLGGPPVNKRTEARLAAVAEFVRDKNANTRLGNSPSGQWSFGKTPEDEE